MITSPTGCTSIPLANKSVEIKILDAAKIIKIKELLDQELEKRYSKIKDAKVDTLFKSNSTIAWKCANVSKPCPRFLKELNKELTLEWLDKFSIGEYKHCNCTADNLFRVSPKGEITFELK